MGNIMADDRTDIFQHYLKGGKCQAFWTQQTGLVEGFAETKKIKVYFSFQEAKIQVQTEQMEGYNFNTRSSLAVFMTLFKDMCP